MEVARNEAENSSFETSHVVGSLLAASQLLANCWRLCVDSGAGFAVSELGGAVYVGFSGAPAALRVQDAAAVDGTFELTAIGGNSTGRCAFVPLLAGDGDGGAAPVLVQALALRCFYDLYNSADFQMAMDAINGKPVIFTGHSMGGCVASLAALYRLCVISSAGAAAPVLCVTFGSPLLGNEALSRAVVRERWSGSFCHVVSQHDVVPRILFYPTCAVSPRFVAGMQLPSATSVSLSEQEKAEMHRLVAQLVGVLAEQQHSAVQCRSPYRPFGSYALCSPDGAACIDSPSAVVQLLSVTFVTGWPSSASLESAHRSYEDLVVTMPRHLLLKKKIRPFSCDEPATSNYDVGVSLALEASGIGSKGTEAMAAKECLKKRLRQSPSLKCADLAIKLGKVTPYRAQIEWYKVVFDGDGGYYDAFKLRRSPKKYAHANMCRVKLGNFWDGVVDKLDTGELPFDFIKRAKWVNAARFYQLLVEPLDIADYYHRREHKIRGHYIAAGRHRRYELFDKWWKEKHPVGSAGGGGGKRRSKYAGQTQDPCFWARVEEALEDAGEAMDGAAAAPVWMRLQDFERYARKLVEMKEVSVDVLATGSSYSVWSQQWRELKARKMLPFL